MPSLKRHLADVAERILGVRILGRNEHMALMERFESEYLRKFFCHFEIDCVFDVGANAGQYFSRIRKHGFRGPVVSFEPIPELAGALAVRAREDGNLFVEQIALDTSEGPRTFNVAALSLFSSLHAPSNAETGDRFMDVNSVVQTLTIEARTLEQAFAKWKGKLGFERPFLKLDTQGHDLAVIQGGLDVLPHFVGIQTELSIKRIYEGSPSYREALRFYEAHGFELSALLMHPYHFPDLVEVDAILARVPKRTSSLASIPPCCQPVMLGP
jgi:FkbM family methyltransferase